MRKKIKSLILKRLNSLSKKTGIDLPYFLSNGFWLNLEFTILTLLNILVMVLLIRYLSPENYGIYQFIISIISILAILSLNGMNTSILQSSSANKKAFVRPTLIRMKWSLLGSIGLIIVSLYLLYMQKSYWWYLILLSFLFPFIHSFSSFESYLVGKRKIRLKAGLQIIKQLLLSIFLIVILFLSMDVFLLILTFFISKAILEFCIFFYLTRNDKKKEKREDVRATIKYGKEMTFINLIPNVANYIDKLLLPYLFGLEKLAVYSVALIIPETLKGFFKTISHLVFSKIISLDKKSFLHLSKKLLLLSIIPMFVFTIIIWILIPYVIIYILGAQYEMAILPAQVLSVSLFIAPYGNFFNTYLQAKKQSKSIFNYSIITSSIQILLYFVLIPTLGLMGGILSKVLVKVIGITISFYYILKIKE